MTLGQTGTIVVKSDRHICTDFVFPQDPEHANWKRKTETTIENPERFSFCLQITNSEIYSLVPCKDAHVTAPALIYLEPCKRSSSTNIFLCSKSSCDNESTQSPDQSHALCHPLGQMTRNTPRRFPFMPKMCTRRNSLTADSPCRISARTSIL